MKPENIEISQQFSKGNFSFCYDHFANEVEWKIVGNKTVAGRENVIAWCEKMNAEMDSSILNNSNTVSGNNCIVVEGNCKFTSADNKPGEVSYCDVYHFNDGKITSITSYCI